jgi:gliding motility associated protien GldN
MKRFKVLLACIFSTGLLVSVFAQNTPQQPNTTMSPGAAGMPPQTETVLTDVYERVNIIPEKKPVPYPYLREADVMWAKDMWRFIDLRQRMNYPLRYPENEPMEDRYSLYLLLMEGIRSEEITPYAFTDNWNNPFNQPTTMKEISSESKIWVDTIFGENNTILRLNLKGNTVKGFYIREKWYFDKQHSEMRVRIVALAPLIIRNKIENGVELPQVDRIVPFFVYFPQCRRLLATHPIYNPNNDAQHISFDDLFMQRRFASTIAAESNVFANRFIVDFMSGQDALMEAERIKNDLFIQEHDLWEY